MTDARVSLGPVFDAFSVPATVTPPGGPPVACSVVWIFPTTELAPSGLGFQVADPRYLLCIRTADVAAVPTGTVIVAAEHDGDPVKTWVVDGLEREEYDHRRVRVRPQESES